MRPSLTRTLVVLSSVALIAGASSIASAQAAAISDIAVSTGDTTATINWTTDVPATGQIAYGETTSYNASSTYDATLSTSHVGYLGGLVPGSLYHFQILAGDGDSVHPMSTSADQTFTTSGGTTGTTTTSTSTTPLALTGVDSVNTTATADGTFGNGWKWTLHFTVPDSETNFALKFGDFTTSGSSGTIPANANIRYSSAQAQDTGAITETGNDYGGSMTLVGDTSSTTPGRQIDVTVEVAVPSGTPTGSYSTTFGARSQ